MLSIDPVRNLRQVSQMSAHSYPVLDTDLCLLCKPSNHRGGDLGHGATRIARLGIWWAPAERDTPNWVSGPLLTEWRILYEVMYLAPGISALWQTVCKLPIVWFSLILYVRLGTLAYRNISALQHPCCSDRMCTNSCNWSILKVSNSQAVWHWCAKV